MSASIEIDESNTAALTLTDGVTGTCYGSIDAAVFDVSANPINQGGQSFEKWNAYHVTDLGGSSVVRALRYYTSALASGWSLYGNQNESQTSYDATKRVTALTPVASVSTIAINQVSTTEPAGPNIGIAGSLSGSFSAPGRSDWLVRQLRCANAVIGGTCSEVFGYDEVA